MNGTTLREATRADAAALAILHVNCWVETYAGLVPDELLSGLSVDASTEMWTGLLNGEGVGHASVFVVEEEGRMVGFGSCGDQRDKALAALGFSGEIGALYVLRSHQRLGLGRTIMAALSQRLSASGHGAASLWVLRDNGPARAFYDALRGEIVGERVDERSAAALHEVAYGWRNLASLVTHRRSSVPRDPIA